MDLVKAVLAAIPVVHGAVLDFRTPLEEAGFQVVDLGFETRKGDDDLARALADADVLIPGNLLKVDGELLQAAPRLKLIAKPGAGLDNIDLQAAAARGVLVCHTPGVNAQSVADHAWALILNLLRRVNEQDRDVRSGVWRKAVGGEAWGKAFGVVGMGAIGRAVAARAAGFNMEVLGYDPYWPESLPVTDRIERVGLEALLKRSDVVTLHCPLTDETRNLIGAAQLAQMKPTAILINTARGGVVDEAALAEALTRGLIAGAGLDAFVVEPLSASPLAELPNVILTPHSAWLSREALEATAAETAAAVIAVSRGRRPRHPANPEVAAYSALRESSTNRRS